MYIVDDTLIASLEVDKFMLCVENLSGDKEVGELTLKPVFSSELIIY